MDLNPNDPRALGLEWRPRRRVEYPISTTAEEPLTKVGSSVVETITAARVGLASAIPNDAPFAVEVMPLGSEKPSGFGCVLLACNKITQVGGSNAIRNEAGSATNPHLSIDDLAGQSCASPAPSLSTYLQNTVLESGFYSMRGLAEFDTTPLAGKRILAVRARAYVGASAGVSSVVTFSLSYSDNNDPPNQPDQWANYIGNFIVPGTFLAPTEYVLDLIGDGYATANNPTPPAPWVDDVDPMTGEPWRLDTMNTFDTTGSRCIDFVLTSGSSGLGRIFDLALEVDYCTENRVALGTLHDAENGWNTVPVRAPLTGTASWAKTIADFKMGVRRLHRTTGTISWVSLDDGEDVGPPGGSTIGELDTDGTIAVEGELTTPGFAWALQRSDLATSVDGQPYIAIENVEVSADVSVEQEFRGADGSTYRHVGLQVRDAGTPQGQLLVEIVRRSDAVVMFSATFTGSDFDDVTAERGWRRMSTSVVGAVLAAATQYAVRLTSTAPAGSGWTVGVLATDDGETSTSVALASYGGTTDIVTIDGVDDSTSDLPTLVATLPTAPTGLAVATQVLALPGTRATKGTRHAIDNVEYGRVSWDATALGVLFGWYEIQRDDGDGWATVAYIEDEGIGSVDDHEALFGIEACWRVRVVRVDGVPSDWTDAECLTLVGPACGYVFSTNQNPALTVAYVDTYDRGTTGPVREYDLPDAEQVVLHTFLGRDGYVAFIPAERLGQAFTRRLAVSSIVAMPTRESRMVDDLVAITIAAVPYVCVRTHDGDRWFANVRASRPRVQRSMNVVTVDVAVVVVQFTPYPMTLET